MLAECRALLTAYMALLAKYLRLFLVEQWDVEEDHWVRLLVEVDVDRYGHERVAVCCSVLQCVAAHLAMRVWTRACCSALQCVAVRCSVLQRMLKCRCGHERVAVRCSVLQCVAAHVEM